MFYWTNLDLHSPELQLRLYSNEMGKEHRRLIHQAITFKYPWLETRITLSVSDCDGDDIEAKNKALVVNLLPVDIAQSYL